jgi:hypothetical protein
VGSIPITRSNPLIPMHRLYQARDRIEAQLLRDFLDRHLVDAVILGDYLAGAAGGLPADISPSVWVLEDEDRERGRELLARFQADAALGGSGADWTCATCGESVEGDFDVCWNCGHLRTECDS